MNMAAEIKKMESLQQEQQLEQVTQEAPKGAFGFPFGQSSQTKPGLQFVCGGPGLPTTQAPLQLPRHPETGQPIQQSAFGMGIPMNNRCFPVSSQVAEAQQDKKKILDSLYKELTTIRSEIDKLNKSVDTIYSIIRYL